MRSACAEHCPLCYSNRRGRSNYKGHWGYRRCGGRRHVKGVAMLRKPIKPDASVKSLGDFVDERFSGLYPVLAEYLASGSYEDGSLRQTASLTLFTEDGRLKACLSDKDNGRVGFISADSFLGLLEALEVALSEDSMDWRASKPVAGGGRPGKRS
jgi:hypothetical protein